MSPLIKEIIVEKITNALKLAKESGALPLSSMPDPMIEHPANPDHGDFATSLPLRLARSTRISPIKIADTLVDLIAEGGELSQVSSAPPGFINFFLSQSWLQKQVELIRQSSETFGTLTVEHPKRIMVEFVSVNPTGPVHVGHARGAVLGSTLASILEAAGHIVSREYYINDAGTQMDLFYDSVLSRYLQTLGHEADIPSGGYQGSYVVDLAEEIKSDSGDSYINMKKNDALTKLAPIARQKMVSMIKNDLSTLGVHFDVWFPEHQLFESGEYAETIKKLQDGGYLALRDGALWLTSTASGEQKDNVVVRSSGAPTYFASDIAYHNNKFLKRGFDRVINIWGADHQGHVSRLKAAVGALGIDPAHLDIIISQMVTLKRGQELVKASKRTGEFVTLRELVDEVGSDACRYFFLARAPGSQMDFDMELATKESSDNPVYYVQYAHARVSSILDSAGGREIDWDAGDVSLLTDPNELTMIRKMLIFPELIEQMAQSLEPHHLPHYALELAASFHWFYENCRVLSNDPADYNMTLARLKLVESAGIVLSKVLRLMGMSTPERM
ncbi:arginine--tRNA ligase [SAR202 cluster bacterium AD-804-J14_MRT_500m]|nr:arginine--tRNA ligase [SAR202 cluster bacterium AD-804-J14_MRT_500m]